VLSIGVVGAGIGGLTVALALREAGLRDVHVYERGEPGGVSNMGLILTPNATRVLHALGMKDELRGLCGHPQTQLQRTGRSGFVLAQRPLGQFAEDRYGAPHCIVGHANLLRVLLDACNAHGISIAGNQSCTNISQPEGAVVVELGDQRASHDVVIGCDGTASMVRRYLNYPEERAQQLLQAPGGVQPQSMRCPDRLAPTS